MLTDPLLHTMRTSLTADGMDIAAEVAVRAISGQAVPQLEQELLHRLYVHAFAAFHEGSCAQSVLARRGIGFHCSAAREYRIAIIHKGQLIPVRPLPGGHLRFHAAVVEAALLYGVTVADVHAHMPVKAQCNAGHLGQCANGAPGAALALGVAEHAVGGFVRAAMRAVLSEKVLSIPIDSITPCPPFVRW